MDASTRPAAVYVSTAAGWTTGRWQGPGANSMSRIACYKLLGQPRAVEHGGSMGGRRTHRGGPPLFLHLLAPSHYRRHSRRPDGLKRNVRHMSSQRAFQLVRYLPSTDSTTKKNRRGEAGRGGQECVSFEIFGIGAAERRHGKIPNAHDAAPRRHRTGMWPENKARAQHGEPESPSRSKGGEAAMT